MGSGECGGVLEVGPERPIKLSAEGIVIVKKRAKAPRCGVAQCGVRAWAGLGGLGRAEGTKDLFLALFSVIRLVA